MLTELIRTATACAATAALAATLTATGTSPTHASPAPPPAPMVVPAAAPTPGTPMILGANPAVVTSDVVDAPGAPDTAAAHITDEPGPGDQSSWRALATQAGRPMATPTTPVRWDPCATITWTFDNPSWDDDLPNARASIRQISGATGLRFREVGPKQHAAVRITLVDFTTLFPLSWRGSFAVTDTTPTKPSTNTWWSYTKATIYLNSWRFHQNNAYKVMMFSGRDLTDGLRFQTRQHRRHVILHELGHVVGLHHTNWWAPANRTSVMATGVDSITFTDGDRAGLRAVGARGGCHRIPAPVRVATGIPSPNRDVTAVQLTTPINPGRTFTTAWLCTGGSCTRGSRGPNPNAPGVATWRFPTRCTLTPRTLTVVTESRFHTRTVTSTVRAGCPPAPPPPPRSTGWTRLGSTVVFGWAATSDSADVDRYSFRISAANSPTRMPASWTTAATAEAIVAAAKPGATYTVEATAHNAFGDSPPATLTYVTTVGAGTVLPVRTATVNGAVVGRVTVTAARPGALHAYGCAGTHSGETVTYPAGTSTVTVGAVTDGAGTLCLQPSVDLIALRHSGLTGAGIWRAVPPVAVTRTVTANSGTTLSGGGRNAAIRIRLSLTSAAGGAVRVGACAAGAPTTVLSYAPATTWFDLLTTTSRAGTICVTPSTAATLVTTVLGRASAPGTLTVLYDTTDAR